MQKGGWIVKQVSDGFSWKMPIEKPSHLCPIFPTTYALANKGYELSISALW